mgnify:CR=1 FL=1
MLNLPKLIGHRGVKNLSPENTIDSINLAKNFGLQWVEIDVKITKDLVPIIFHDDTLERTTNGVGSPIDYRYSEIKKLDAGYFFYKKKTKIYIPTFENILLLSQKKNINLNIELKPNKGFEKENVESVAKVLKNSTFLNSYYFSSFDLNSLIMMKDFFPNANYGLLIDKFHKNRTLNHVLKICNKYNFFCCGFNKNIISLNVINKFLSNNRQVTVYSEKNVKVSEAEVLWSMGVKSIFIDDPSDFSNI